MSDASKPPAPTPEPGMTLNQWMDEWTNEQVWEVPIVSMISTTS